MKISKSFSIEAALFMKLEAYCLDHRTTKNRIMETLITELTIQPGLLKDCDVCGANYSDKLLKCPQCAQIARQKAEKDAVLWKKIRIKNLKKALEGDLGYSPEQITALKTELAKLEKV